MSEQKKNVLNNLFDENKSIDSNFGSNKSQANSTKNNQYEIFSGVDRFVKYMNKNIKKGNKYYNSDDRNIIRKYNNYLYFLAKAGVVCMDKN
jgi:hypothetical protein